MYKKIVVFIICSSILIISCSKQKKNTVTFSVGGAPAELLLWQKLIEEFNSLTGIEVHMLRQPTDTDQMRQGLVISLNSRMNNPDVFLMDVAWISQIAASNWLEPLDSYIERDNVDSEIFLSNVIDSIDTYKGKLIAFPVFVDGGLLYYRKDLLKKYGIEKPPETWGQLVNCSLKIQKDSRKTNPNFYGFVWQGAQYEGLVCTFMEFAASNGGGILFKHNKILLDLNKNREALQFMSDLIYKYQISPPSIFTEMKEEEVRIFFQQGNALFERNWPYAWSLHQSENSKIKDDVGIALLPHFPLSKSVSSLGGWHIGISRYSDRKFSSWKFINFVISYRVQKKLAMELGWNPGRKDMYTDNEILKKLPHFKKLKIIFEHARPRPIVPYYTQISEIIQRYVNAVLAGELKPKVALSSAEREANKIIERYK